MRNGSRRDLFAMLFLLSQGLLADSPPMPGVVVEEVGAGSALERAGVRPGDVLLSWRRLAQSTAAAGTLTSFFDWPRLILEQAPRGTIELVVERGGEPSVVAVAPGLWDARVRPRMPVRLEQTYREGVELLAAGDPVAATVRWQAIAASDEAREDWRLRCWILLRSGQAWAELGRWEEARAAFGNALAEARDPLSRAAAWRAIARASVQRSEFESARQAFAAVLEIEAETGDETLAVAESLGNLGIVAWRQGRLDLAQDYLERALGIRRRLALGSLPYASSLGNLGMVLQDRGELKRAAEYLERALAIHQRLAPDSLVVAANLTNLGNGARKAGEPQRAAEYHERALAIHQRRVPGSLEEAASLDNLGNVARDRGDLQTAVAYHERALAIRRRLAPRSHEVAMSFNNLGTVAGARGDLEQAADAFSRALSIWQELAPEALHAATALSNLAVVARLRGELDVSADYLARSLEIRRRLAPGSLDEAACWVNLGEVARDRGALGEAKEHFVRALEIQQRVAPASLGAAASLASLGTVASELGDPERAAEYHEQALEIRRRQAPGSLLVAESLYELGRLAEGRGELDRAAEAFTRAFDIQQELAPDSYHVAKTLHGLGTLHRRRGELETAIDHFRRAVTAFERQVGKIGGSHDVHAGFRAGYLHLYRDALELELELEQPAAAFHTLERSRARTFLALLAERDTVFAADVPAELDQARRAVGLRYDRIQERIAVLHPGDDGAEIAELRRRQLELRREAEGIAARIRELSPRLAALHYPEPLEIREARQALDPGTVLLSYSVGKERTYLFTASRSRDLEVATVAVGEDDLRRDVERFRKLIAQALPGDVFGDLSLARVRELGGRLYDLLVRPIEDRVAVSDRVLILPDGPLHLLPFGALRRATEPEAPYLAEWKPLHTALSATVYAELRGPRREEGLLAAFGDPRYPPRLARQDPATVDDVRLRSAVSRGLFEWTALPYSRREVERIAALYPAPAVRLYLGPEATEDRVKSLGRDVRILHIAAHSFLDERFPLSSFVALTVPETLTADRDNGLLQAWEVFEQVRLDADLVVLAACESGGGKELDGEGLIGLTRAFQYAGARSVAAALWRVSDQSTAELMVRFYRHLRAGKPKDVALRAAQIELIRGPIRVDDGPGRQVVKDASAPYFWAAFQIYGDWR